MQMITLFALLAASVTVTQLPLMPAPALQEYMAKQKENKELIRLHERMGFARFYPMVFGAL